MMVYVQLLANKFYQQYVSLFLTLSVSDIIYAVKFTHSGMLALKILCSIVYVISIKYRLWDLIIHVVKTLGSAYQYGDVYIPLSFILEK